MGGDDAEKKAPQELPPKCLSVLKYRSSLLSLLPLFLSLMDGAGLSQLYLLDLETPQRMQE
eukprot:scaffold885_cov209-Skeletonema_marinoi.AAC.1